MNAERHPVFVDAPRSRQWVRPPRYLYGILQSEAIQNLKAVEGTDREATDFAWRILEDGTVVGLRMHTKDSRLELRIAHPDEPEGAKEEADWSHRVSEILKDLCIRPVDGEEPCVMRGNQWLRIPPVPEVDDGRAVQRLLELRMGECRPGKALCWPCFEDGELVETDWWPSAGYRGQRCNACKRPGRAQPEKKDQSELAV